MSNQIWYYFLSIERDFIRTIDFVHLDVKNSGAFSNEYAKLLLLIGSETDVVAKMLCNKIDATKEAENIEDYRSIIRAKFPGMHTIEIEIARFGLKVQPWSSWDPTIGNSPSWWKAHNHVKHERDKNFPEANQLNTLHALCGLFALHLYMQKDLSDLEPFPALLNFGFPEYLWTNFSKKLPGV
jgi:hypothetical protein